MPALSAPHRHSPCAAARPRRAASLRGALRLRRGAPLALIAAAALVAIDTSGAIASDQSYPRRRAGLWEVRTVIAQASGLSPTRFCVGEGTDSESSQLDRSVGARGACTLGGFQRAGTSWVAESVCREGRTKVVSRAIASGDFDTEYRIDTVVNYDPPLGGVRREDKEALVARHLGPCEDGQKPGDMVIPGMGTLNMVDGTFRAEPVTRPARRQRPAR